MAQDEPKVVVTVQGLQSGFWDWDRRPRTGRSRVCRAGSAALGMERSCPRLLPESHRGSPAGPAVPFAPCSCSGFAAAAEPR